MDESSFPKKTNEQEADWSDVEAAIAALNAAKNDPAAWRAALEKTFDPYGFMHWLAINTTIQDWDTYGNMAHNYYLYGDPQEGGVLHWIPWDHNLSLAGMGTFNRQMGGPLPLDMSSVADKWPLIRFLYDDEVYRAAYHMFLKHFIDGPFAIELVQARLRSEHKLIAEFVTGAHGESSEHSALDDPAGFETALDTLLTHVTERHQAVVDYLGRLANYARE